MAIIYYTCEACENDIRCDTDYDLDIYNLKINVTDYAGKIALSALTYTCPEEQTEKIHLQFLNYDQTLNMLMTNIICISSGINEPSSNQTSDKQF